MLHRMSSAGAIGDVQIFGGCQAPAEPMLTQALNNDAVVIHQFFLLYVVKFAIVLVTYVKH